MISRYFSAANFARLQNDFRFLPGVVRSFKGELEFSLRDNYFNLYFRGNNAAKVVFASGGRYRVSIHRKFYPQRLEDDARFTFTTSGSYRNIETSAEFLHPLLQKQYLSEIYAKIRRENYSEELAFEQLLIADNVAREDLILIDRQVTDKQLAGRRMDLLALQQKQENQYQFLVLELKMGKNPELKDRVAQQLSLYLQHIEQHYSEYQQCYEKHYRQKQQLGLLEGAVWDSIEIVPGVRGMIVVGGYSGLAREQIEHLQAHYPNLKVQLLEYKISIA